MKKYLRIISGILLLTAIFSQNTIAQKKVVKKSSIKTTQVKFTEREFATQTSISDVTDLTDASPAYNSVKNLIETYGVSTVYADNTFKGKEPLRRGDFIVGLNSALTNVKKSIDDAGLDTSLLNTYDKNASYITGVNELKDVKPTSIYYSPAQSLIEKFGVAAPFTKSKMLNAGSTISEKEVYDILHVTLGYTSTGFNPYSSGITREKFAIVLNNALSQKMSEINKLKSEQQAKRDEERRMQMDSLKKMENSRRDSISKEIDQRKIDAAKQEEEARKKLADKKKD